MKILNWISNRLECFWCGHDVPEEYLEFESEMPCLPIPCKRCDNQEDKT